MHPAWNGLDGFPQSSTEQAQGPPREGAAPPEAGNWDSILKNWLHLSGRGEEAWFTLLLSAGLGRGALFPTDLEQS